jgi:hypothetical protein
MRPGQIFTFVLRRRGPAARPGERPSVSWLVETPKRKPTLPQHTQLPPRTFPEGELFHSPGLPRQRLPGVPALKKFRKPVGLRLNAARHTPFAGSTRCATGERHSTRWPETDRTSRRGSAQEGQSPTKSPHTFPRHPHLSPSPTPFPVTARPPANVCDPYRGRRVVRTTSSPDDIAATRTAVSARWVPTHHKPFRGNEFTVHPKLPWRGLRNEPGVERREHPRSPAPNRTVHPERGA